MRFHTRSQDTFEVSYYITLIGMLACCYSVTPWTLRCNFGVCFGQTSEKKTELKRSIYTRKGLFAAISILQFTNFTNQKLNGW